MPASPDAAGDLLPHLRVLGDITASRGDQPIDLGGPRQRSVLARLVIGRGGIVSSDQIIGALWGDDPPAAATASLQTYISHLRRRLQPDLPGRSRSGVIASAAGGYALQLPVDAVDAWRFEHLLRQADITAEPVVAVTRLTEALGLWRGPAYTGLPDATWAEGEITRLTDLRAVAGEHLLAARLNSGEQASLLVPELEVLVSEEPLREERWRLLVLALYRCGRQADALAALRRARTVLAEELGVDPGPALRALESEVLAQSPALDAVIPDPRARPGGRAASTGQGGAASPTSASTVSDFPAPVPDGAADRGEQPPAPVTRRSAGGRRPRDEMVERDREVAELDACLADALDGSGRLALISGPAGIGKSRLLAEARHLVLDAGATLLNARCSELEREFGFGAVRQLFEPLLADPARRDQLLRGSAVAAGPVFDVDPGAPAGADADESSFATLHGLYWLTLNLAADRPLVLVVDDLHWCDSGSLRYLTYLVRRLEGLPVLIIATVRTGEQAVDEQLLDELRVDVATVPIRPAPLSAAGLRRIISTSLRCEPDPAFTAACYDTTSGNPLLLRQLLRALESEGVRPDAAHADTARALGSRAIGSMVLLRLSRLPDAASAVARALAVLGDGAALPVVAALAGLDEASAAAATAGLARVEVLRPESPLAFVHALVRNAVVSDLSPGERELLHDRAARLLDRAGATPEQVAAQLLLAPRRADGWAVDVLRHAAAAAMRRGAPDGATSYLRRAIAEPPAPTDRAEVLLELARAESFIDGPAALADLSEAYGALPDHGRRAGAALALARTMVFIAPRGTAAAFARDARAELPETFVDERQGLLALGRISVHMHGLDAAEWQLVAAGFAEPTPEGGGPGARMLAAQIAWERMCVVEPRQRVIEMAQQALEGGSLYAADNGLLWVVATMVQDLADVDVMPLWENAVALAHQRGSLFAVLSVSLWRGYSLRHRGELPEAEESLRTSIEQLSMYYASGSGDPYAEAELIRCLIDQDRVAEARRHLSSSHPPVPGSDGHRLMLEAEASVLLAEERWAVAVPLLEEANALVPHVRNPAWRRGPELLAAALAGMGRTPEALAILDEQIAAADRWGAESIRGALRRQAGQLRLAEDPERGMAELGDAEMLLAHSLARLEHGEALFALGEALLSAAPTDRARAVGLLLRALEVAESCSADRLRRRTTAALGEAGVVVPEVRKVGLAALTSTQRRVAMLAADGVALRDVAQALFLTPRVVEQHLADVRERLGVGPDEDLAAALAAAADPSDPAGGVEAGRGRRGFGASLS